MRTLQHGLQFLRERLEHLVVCSTQPCQPLSSQDDDQGRRGRTEGDCDPVKSSLTGDGDSTHAILLVVILESSLLEPVLVFDSLRHEVKADGDDLGDEGIVASTECWSCLSETEQEPTHGISTVLRRDSADRDSL